jgi:hypothetical protein
MTCRKSKIIFQDHNVPLTCENVELRGFEPLTFCMPYRAEPSPGGARRRHASRLPAVTLARCGLTWPGACRRWLPTWLPENSLAALTTGRPNKLPARCRPRNRAAEIFPGHLRGAPRPAPARPREPGNTPPHPRDPLTLYLGTSGI